MVIHVPLAYQTRRIFISDLIGDKYTRTASNIHIFSDICSGWKSNRRSPIKILFATIGNILLRSSLGDAWFSFKIMHKTWCVKLLGLRQELWYSIVIDHCNMTYFTTQILYNIRQFYKIIIIINYYIIMLWYIKKKKLSIKKK